MSYLVRRHQFCHLIFLDLKMPEIDGFDFLRWHGQQPFSKQNKIIVLTGSVLSSDIHTVKRLGASEFLTKPISEATLKRILTVWF
jgi:CheY-like chemotaxis protein